MSFVDVRDFASAMVGDDWTPAFDKAIEAVEFGGYAGIVVPASPTPYKVRKPATQHRPSIDLRGLHGFTLLGEGDRSVIAMVGPGSWRMIHTGGQATDIQIRDLSLNGTDLEDADQQSHLIVVGTSITKPGGARRVSIVNCKLEHAAADAVAIAPKTTTDPSEEVSDITVAGCHLLDNGRSGVSNQRLGKRISILHNHFAGTRDQDIDFEPSGDLPDSGPSGYLILGNTMVRADSGVSVTLSGTSPESPSNRNTFAYNQIYGGRLGLHNAQDLSIIGNYIECGLNDSATVVRMGGLLERLLLAGNIVVRPPNASQGALLNISSDATTLEFAATSDIVDVATDTLKRKGHGLQTGVGPLRASTPPDPATAALPTGLTPNVDYWAIRIDADHLALAASPQEAMAPQAVDLQDVGSDHFLLTRNGFPRGLSIQGNRLSTHVRLPDGEALVTFTNASAVSFRDNDLVSFAGTDLAAALKFGPTPARKRPLKGWEIVGNRFRGDAKLPPEFDQPGLGAFNIAVSLAAGRDGVRDVRVSENTFAGCHIQVQLQAEVPGAFATPPAVTGNTGVGTALVIQGKVPAVLVGGNQETTVAPQAILPPAGARYCGAGDPTFKAPIGSLFTKTDGQPGNLLYINADGKAAWTAIA